MEKQQYVFKLNVQPHILKKYSEQTLFKEFIPNKIFNTFNNLHTQVDIGDKTLNFQIQRDYNDILKSEEYKSLISKTDKFAIEYKQITFNYQNEGNISYSKEFLEEHEKLMELRKELIAQFSVLTYAGKQYKSSETNQSIEEEYQFQIESKVGIGLDHIKRVQKIKMYAKHLATLDNEDIIIDYDYETELLKILDVNQVSAIDFVKDIERKINKRKDEVSDITINPVYENLVLDTTERTKSLEIIVVYPNGTDEELDILLKAANMTGSREARSEFLAPNDDSNNKFLENTQKLAENPGGKGYLRDVKNQGKSIINVEQTTIKTMTSTSVTTILGDK